MTLNPLACGVVLSLLGTPAMADQCLPSDNCVGDADLKVFVAALHEKKCLLETKPAFRLPPIQVTEDQSGRVFVSGGPTYTIHFDWCNYAVDADAQLAVQVAQAPQPVVPDWGFRYRLKLATSYLPVEALTQQDGYAGLDVGLMLEPVFFRSLNLNGYVGVRSFGIALGYDLTRNIGISLGYVTTLNGWRSNSLVSLTFSLW